MRLLIFIAAIFSSCIVMLPLQGEPPQSVSVCVSGVAATWKNTSFATQTAQFTATYDAIPGQTDLNGVIGFSLNAATVDTSLAAITRFNPSGTIDARNGGVYAADVSLPYKGRASYHFRLIINPATQHYSVYVTPPGASEIALASNYAFRSEQSGISSVNNWAVNSGIGSASVCNMTIAASIPTVTAPAITTQPANRSVVAGQTASFSVGATGTAPLSYQWKKNGTAISGATSSSYTTPAETTSDNGAQFTVVISNSAGSVTSAAATLTVASLPGTLSLSSSGLTFGSVNVGSHSTYSTTLTNTGGSSVAVASVSVSGAGFNVSGVFIGQIIGVGQTATLNVTFAPAAGGSVGGSVTLTSNASNSPTTISLSGTGAAVSHWTALSWTASSSTAIGYNVYRSAISGGPYTKLTTSMISATTYSDTGVQAGLTYYYVVTALDSRNVESAPSNQVVATIP